MAEAVIATITAIEGTAYARSAEGELRELRVGDELRQGETLVTPEGSQVTLEGIEGDGEAMVVAQVEELTISADMIAQLAADADEAAIQDETLDEVIAALEGDGDLSEILEAPAAGAGDGSNAGSSFIRLGRIVEETPEFSGLRSTSGTEQNLFVEQAEPIIGGEAEPDADETPQGTPVTVQVVTNDNFPNGAQIIAVSNPDNGSATFNAEDGTVTFTPDEDFTGEEVFTYTVRTPDGSVTDQADVTIDVIPDPTVTVNDVTVNESEGSLTFTLTRSGDLTRTGSVDYSLTPDTATTPADYGGDLTGTVSFAAGEATQTVTVAIVDDDIDELDEQFTIDLSNGVRTTIADAQGIGTIVDNDAAPELSISDVTVNEGETASFTVTLTGQTDREVSVDLGTADGTAIALAAGDGDYDAATGTLTFSADPAATNRTLTFDVATNDDAIDEPDETFTVNLSDPANATIADGEGVGTIVDNDDAPGLSISDVTVNEGETASFTVTLSGQTDGVVSVDLGTADGSAIALAAGDGDYDAATGTLTFAADPAATSRTLTFEVATNDDSVLEPDETFTVDLSNASGATITDPQGVGTILDNDEVAQVAVDDVTVNESDGTLTFTLTKTGETALDGSVDYVINPGTATTPADYGASDPLSGTVEFLASETSKTVTVAIVDDNIDEPDEQFTIDLANPVNLGIADDQGIGTILDNDDAPTLSISDVTVPEGETAVFTVTLSGQTDQPVTVNLDTTDGSAIALTAGNGDYDATTGTLTFPTNTSEGTQTLTFAVATNDDTVLEPNETFTVNLSDPSNATIADGEGVGTIIDNDGAPQVIVDDVTVNEGDGTLTFTLTKTGETALDGSVDYVINPGTATTAADYGASDPLSGTVEFLAGETSKTVTVAIVDDTIDELDEQFTIDLANPVNLGIGDNQGVGTIIDNDEAPELSISDVTVPEGDTAVFTITLDGQTDQVVSVDLTTMDDSALQIADGQGDYDAATGTLTFAADPSATSRTLTFEVETNQDAINELDETFTVNLSNASNATIADSQGVGTIIDDDLPTAADASAATEDESLGSDSGSLDFDFGTDTAVSFGASYDGGLGPATQTSSGGVTTISSDAGIWTLAINESTGAYTFNQLAPYAHDVGADSDSAAVTVTLTDNGGNDVTNTLTLSIGDDGPAANPDAETTTEGATITGNVVDDAIAASDDSAGADGFAAAGPVVGVAAGSNTATAISSGVGAAIVGSHGTLTLGATGSYSYEADTSVPAGQTDSFVYTIEDADGDTSTTTLTFTFTGDSSGPSAQNGAAQTEDATLGSDNGSLNFNLGDDTPVAFDASYTDQGLGPATRIVGAGETSFKANDGSWTVTVNHSTGAYVFTQNAAIDHTAGFDLAEGLVSITLTDNDGSIATSALALAIGDDGPTAVNDGNLGTFEEDVSNQTLGPVSLLSGNDDFGADGPGSPSLTIGGGNLGGSVTISGGNLVYTNTAHNVQSGDTDVETFSYTIRDSDGDTDSGTFTVSLTDGAVVMGEATDLLVDDDDAVTPLDDGNPGGTDDDSPLTTGGTVTYTLNDPLDTVTLSTAGNQTGLTTLDGAGVVTSFNATTGVLTGFKAGGSAAITADQVFTITLGTPTTTSVGYEMVLLQPVQHPEGSDENNVSFDVNVTVTEDDGSTGSTAFTVSIDDDTPVAGLNGFGDTSEAEQFPSFLDRPTLTVDESELQQDDPEDTEADRQSQADFSVLFSGATPPGQQGPALEDQARFGADGPGSISYALSLTLGDGSTAVGSGGIESGLYAVENGGKGGQVRLYDNAGTIEGRVGSTVYFTITADSDGNVTLTQADDVSLWHPVAGAPGAPHDDVVSLTGQGDGGNQAAVTYAINLTQTVTDADGDSASATANLVDQFSAGQDFGTGFAFNFSDDGPTATALVNVELDEGTTHTGTLTFGGGADGATVTAVDGETLNFGTDGYSQSINIGGGSIKVKAGGSYSFTADEVTGDTTASSAFTVTDSDGDTATADITIEVLDTNVPPVAHDDPGTGSPYSVNVGGSNDATWSNTDSKGSPVTIGAFNVDGSAGVVSNLSSTSNPRLGVAAEPRDDVPEQLQYEADSGRSEALVFSFDGYLNEATVTTSNLIVGEGGDERGVWVALLDDTVVATGDVTVANGGEVTINTGSLVFNQLRFEARSYTSNVAQEIDNDSSDYFVSSISGSGPAVANNPYTTTEDQTLTVAPADGLLPNDNDPENQPISVVTINPGTAGAQTVAVSGTTTVMLASGAELEIGSDGSFDYDPNGAFDNLVAGTVTTDAFTYRIADADGDSSDVASGEGPNTDSDSIATVTITIIGKGSPYDPAPPKAVADTVTTEDASVTIDVLNNDTDDGNDLEVIDFTDPANGSVDYNSDGTRLEYTPNSGFSGTDSFEYMIEDGTGLTHTATVTVTVNPINDPPIAVNDSYSTSEDTVLTVDGNVLDSILDNDSDLDGDTLTVNTTPVTSVSNGTLVLNSNGTFTYTPNADFNGTDSFVYEVSDGNGATDTATVTITVDSDNDPPTIVNETTRVSEEGLPGGNPDTTGRSDTTNSLTSGGTIAIGDLDGDSLTVEFTGSLPADGDLKSGGVNVVFERSADNKTVTGTAGNTTVLVATVADDGAYSSVLSAPLDHPSNDIEDEIAIDLGVSVSDGTDSATGTLTVIVEDDRPEPTTTTVSLPVPVSVVNVTDIGASWSGINPSSVSDDNDDSDGAIGLNWGSGSPTSGYEFVIEDDTINLDQQFKVGTLTHFNNPISGTVLDTVNLDVNFDVVIDGLTTNVSTTVGLDHDETDNDATLDTDPANNDVISITNPSTTQSITVDDRTYQVQVKGFLTGSNGDLVTSVETVETKDTSFSLWAEIQSTDDLPELGSSVTGFVGADSAGSISWDNDGTEVATGTILGDHGTLTILANGGYEYVMDRDERDGLDVGQELTDTFTWYLTDDDGDRVSSTLDIELTGVQNNTPIALDLDNDGAEYLSRDAGVVFTDQSTGEAVNTAWVAPDDGLLVVDANNSGTVDESREYVFTEWSETAETDMEAVREVFDTNQDGVLDAQDEQFEQFGVWQDADSDGVTDEGELLSLGEMGIDSIALNYREDSEAGTAADGDVVIHGQSDVTWSDGSTSVAEDTSFAVEPLDLRDLLGDADSEQDLGAYFDVSYDGADTVVKVSSTGAFSNGSAEGASVDQTFTFEGVDLIGDQSLDAALKHMMDAGKLNADQ